jgi:hypothetical protein
MCLQVREFLQGKLSSLRKPKTNISIIQQNVLLKYKYFVRFLEAHGPDVHQEVRQTGAGVCHSPRSGGKIRRGAAGCE